MASKSTDRPAPDYRDRLKAIRTKAKLSQPELAKRIGVGMSTVSATERHLSHPSAPVLIAWAEACGHGFEWLLSDALLAETYPKPALDVELELS